MHRLKIQTGTITPEIEPPAQTGVVPEQKPLTIASSSGGTLRQQEGGFRHSLRNALEEQNSPRSQRTKPVLANGVNLCREIGRMLGNARLSMETPTVIATTYASRITHDHAENIAANLILDLNLMFEEKLQHVIEEEPYFTTEIKKGIELIHSQLNIESIVVDQHHPLGSDHRANRIEFLYQKLKQYYPEGALRNLIDAQDGRDSTINNFVARHPLLDRNVSDADRVKVIGYLKLIKQLFGQHPYFGGSVEYKQGIEDSLEYWVYHLSTLTRDPDRSIPLGKHGYGHLLLKPMSDYFTPESGLLPLMNQRNLGTGVAEAQWSELSKAMKRSLKNGISQFRDKRLPDRPEKHMQDLKYSRQFHELMDKVAKLYSKAPAQLSTEEIWTAADEDERKFLYGDIAEIPWSDAHLLSGEGFPHTFNVEIHAEALDYRHPLVTRQRETGLMNVVGLFGNILEKPEVACEKYLNEIRRKLNIPLDQKNFRIRDKEFGIDYNSEFLKNDFIGKQQAWYESAYENYKPIIGGVSGHTLGYLNLYRSAIDKWHLQNRHQRHALPDHPSLETFRGIMLAALIGNKRHHSYDEVMTASVGAKFALAEGDGLQYKDRAGYGDILRSSDPILRQCAQRAASQVEASYLSLDYDTVLSAIELNRPGLRSHLEAPVSRYFRALASGQSEALESAKQSISTVLTQQLGER
jgi:hypothetical protein